jgi:phage terminase large subunit GpA-like protein
MLRQLTAEERALITSGRRTRWVWRKRPGRNDNHYLDCAVQILAIARHLGLEDLGKPGMVPVTLHSSRDRSKDQPKQHQQNYSDGLTIIE